MNAARLLHLTPSAVSQHLASFEREVGLTLVDQSRRRIELNAAGNLLAARAERIEQELTEARRELAARAPAAGSPDRWSWPRSPPRFATCWFRRSPCSAKETHPDVHPRVFDLEGPPAERELRTGGIDMLITERDAENTARCPTASPSGYWETTRTGVVVPTGWTIRPRSVSDLADQPWISGPPESACGQTLDRLAGQHRFTPHSVPTSAWSSRACWDW